MSEKTEHGTKKTVFCLHDTALGKRMSKKAISLG